jgi:phenylalanyl-tRNA synthetase alpha chain
MTDPDALLTDLRARLGRLSSLDAVALEGEHVAVLGRKSGLLTGLLRRLPELEPAERRRIGAEANQLKLAFEAAVVERQADLDRAARARAARGVDLTMPARSRWVGAVHPVTLVVEEIVGIFRALGFTRATGPEAETEWYNFGALNFPPDHPAMDMHDTLYLEIPDRRAAGDRRLNRSSGINPDFERRLPAERRKSIEGRFLLRTHTSPVQIRVMQQTTPPIRVVIPGMCYRRDAFDASHAPVFAQIEGLVVDEGISFVDLKATLIHFAYEFFGPGRAVRFRPSYFPFTEPSAEMDVGCGVCGGSGCPACKGTGWMEILGAGMVHPAVLGHGGLDPERYTGFAFGMGPARIAMSRYGIGDIRLLYEGDMRFLAQFLAGEGAGGPDGPTVRRSDGPPARP